MGIMLIILDTFEPVACKHGYVDEIDLLGLLGVLEPVLQRMGHPVELGAGVAAASAALVQQRASKRGPGG